LSRSFPRLAKAAVAISLASAPLLVFSLPAFAKGAVPAPRYEWWLRTLHITKAWKSAEGVGVTVAVLSDGVAPGQRYLAHSVIMGPDFTNSGRTPGSRYYGVMGTSLASLIAGHGWAPSSSGNKGWNVDGVAPAAKILSIRVTLSPGDPLWSDAQVTKGLPFAIAQGIRYAVRHGATVIDLPADPGIPDPAIGSGSSAAVGGSPAERTAVRYALRRGVVLVAPAGDNGRAGDAPNYPAAYPGVISVGAFGKSFVKAPYSSRQPYVTLTAAGQSVTATNQTGFKTLNSTTAASAIVAGIAALIRSEFPNLNVAQVRTCLIHGTVYRPAGGRLDGSGYGTVDATRALDRAAILSPPHALPAMLGAVARTSPVPPVMESSGTVIAHELVGDAGISAAALAALLVPISLFGTVARRRERREALLAAERSEHGLGRAGHGTMLADPLLEFFGPQHARPAPANARPLATPRFQPRPDLSGRSTMSASLAGRPTPPAAPVPSGPPPTIRRTPAPLPTPVAHLTPPEAPRAAPAGPIAQPTASAGPSGYHQAAGMGGLSNPTVRRAMVSGSPPWEPAEEPTSDLPWVMAPQSIPTRTHEIGAPAVPAPPDSVWDVAPARSSSAPRDMFEPAPPPRSARPTLATPAADAGAGAAESAVPPAKPPARPSGRGTGRDRMHPDSERGPIFAWNPSTSSDQFGAVDPRRADQVQVWD
jgi:hypothetical protein